MKIAIRLSAIISLALLMACSGQRTQPPQTNTSVLTINTFDHKPFDKLLATSVNADGLVDYPGLQKERRKLDDYLISLAAAKPQTFVSEAERLAFWINGYNAFTLADVLDDVYGKMKSVNDSKKIFFETKKHSVAGEQLTLNQIEQQGRNFKDPRIHFALVCASISCPKLQRFAFTGVGLEGQLGKVAEEFLADINRGMRYDPAHNEIYLSSIFKWYADDFTGSNKLVARVSAEASGSDLLEAAKKYLPARPKDFLDEKKPKVKYIDYDWSLNAQKP